MEYSRIKKGLSNLTAFFLSISQKLADHKMSSKQINKLINMQD